MTPKNKGYYTGLITSEYKAAPHFNSLVAKLVDYNIALDRYILKMVDMFDVDTAKDDQLDILGECVGVTRSLSFEPSPAAKGHLYLPGPETTEEFNGDESLYLQYRTPSPANMAETDTVRTLDVKYENDETPLINDDIFRIMVKARIIQNIWKGNVLDLYEMWSLLFPDNLGLQIQDLQDMSFNIVLVGSYSNLMQELIAHGYIIPKPEGVRINMLSFVSTDGLPIFSYDFDTLNYSGYKGHWLQVTKE